MQALVEGSTEVMLGVRFLASEYSTGPVHGGRIDLLGLDESGAPVVVEYKRVTDPGVLSQGLFYMAWPTGHRGEFQGLVRERLGATAASQVLWSAPRLICIAGGYTRYGLHAVRGHRRSIDLLRYRFYGDHPIALETVASVTGQAKPAPRTPRRRPAAGEWGAGEKGAAWDRPFGGRAGTWRWNARSSAGSPISEIGELPLRFRPPTGRRPPARQTPRRSRPMGRPIYRPAPARATTEEQVYQPDGFAVPMARVTAISMTTRFGLTRGVLYRSA